MGVERGRVVGLGIDLVEVPRIRRSLERWGERLASKLMDSEEAARLDLLSTRRPEALAISIALKEAASKAIGTGWSRGVRWRDVVIRPGSPFGVELRNRARDFAFRLGSDGRTRVRLERRDDLIVGEVWLLGC
ncbi:MAG: 4'-phosphopantetheinyl transferase superfamily protein [Vicinamibacteria bacterium]|nr:4'-phosphopantetheinyl transferase superfamily protein [Vicinamibacteria bacterium]